MDGTLDFYFTVDDPKPVSKQVESWLRKDEITGVFGSLFGNFLWLFFESFFCLVFLGLPPVVEDVVVENVVENVVVENVVVENVVENVEILQRRVGAFRSVGAGLRNVGSEEKLDLQTIRKNEVTRLMELQDCLIAKGQDLKLMEGSLNEGFFFFF